MMLQWAIATSTLWGLLGDFASVDSMMLSWHGSAGPGRSGDPHGERGVMHDFIIVGGGILGMSTAMQLKQAYPERRMLLLEKEAGPAMHQTEIGRAHSELQSRPHLVCRL